jgi:hypothetical protein
MTYQDSAALAADDQFTARLAACLTTEAAGRPGDQLADTILTGGHTGVSWFMPLIAVAPGLGEKYAAGGQESVTDGDILSAVQANWARVAGLHP